MKRNVKAIFTKTQEPNSQDQSLTSGISSISPVRGLPGAQPGPFQITASLLPNPSVSLNTSHMYLR